MDQMFIIPHNILLVIGVLVVLATIGFVIYGFVKGWDKVLKRPYQENLDKSGIDH